MNCLPNPQIRKCAYQHCSFSNKLLRKQILHLNPFFLQLASKTTRIAVYGAQSLKFNVRDTRATSNVLFIHFFHSVIICFIMFPSIRYVFYLVDCSSSNSFEGLFLIFFIYEFLAQSKYMILFLDEDCVS